MRRCSCKISSSPVALALLVILVCSSLHSFSLAAARLLQPAAVPLIPHHENGAKAAAAADGLVPESAAGDEMMGADAAACEEGNDECLERRLLHDAHLDYIYTQHKGKP